MTGMGVLYTLCALLLMQFASLPGCHGANILGVFGSESPSHLIVHMSLIKALADRGHNITVVAALKPKLAPHANITVIVVPPSLEAQKMFNERVSKVTKEKTNVLVALAKGFAQSNSMFHSQYEFAVHPKLKSIYDNPQVKFDLVIIGYFMNDLQLGIAAKLNCPVIVNWCGVPFEMLDALVGNVNDPAYVPNFNMALEKGQKTMSFRLRVRNLMTYSLFKVLNMILNYRMNNYYKQAFGVDPDFPTYNDMKRRISMLFMNYHSHSEGPIRPSVPQSVELGGIQIKDTPDPLPKDLAEFLGNASTHGAIFFSLGSNIDTDYVKEEIIEHIYNVLSRLPQRVIWKWSDLSKTPGSASNIYYHNWLPQDDILAHPNTKLFITHAGKGGLAEAQFHGVPMLALPIFADQPGNAASMVASGFGLSLELLTLTEKNFEKSIQEVLQNSTYKEKVGEFSLLYRDRPMTARQTAVYWTEYVLRHKGAYHLQSPVIHMSFIARHNLDVYSLFILVIIALIWLLARILRFVFRKVSRLLHGKVHSYQKVKAN
ncbi:UDP-glycosyltransferase UGT5 [Drosophila tropicalis]|uniref:UDP-glycosyltransferase UGT5 n=1 Tax=Drosophila tropicalis TaxID=46794 RepID=UPI0035AB7A14